MSVQANDRSSELRKIEEREALLDREIAERQKLKDAYRLVREDLARQFPQNGEREQWSGRDEISTLLLEGHGGQPPPGTSKQALERHYGENTRLVRQAIEKMPSDYTIRDIYRYLYGHGWQIGVNPIATVLNRLKKNGEIKERIPGKGRRPTVFKKGTT